MMDQRDNLLEINIKKPSSNNVNLLNSLMAFYYCCNNYLYFSFDLNALSIVLFSIYYSNNFNYF